MNVPPIGIIHIRLNKWDTFTQCTVSSMGRPGWWGGTQESSSGDDFSWKILIISVLKCFFQTGKHLETLLQSSSYHVWIQVTVDDECWISHRHHMEKMWCTMGLIRSVWSALHSGIVWGGRCHIFLNRLGTWPISAPSLYIKCRQTNTDHCQCVDDKLTLWREKVCPITSASVCALTEFSSHVGIQVNPNK